MLHHLLKAQTIFTLALGLFIKQAHAQNARDSTLHNATAEQVVHYALEHQPLVQQAEIDEEITRRVIQGKLADWYPQLNFNYNYQRYFDLQSSVIGGNVIRFGVNNTSSLQLTGSLNVFNRDVLLASSTATRVKVQAAQNTTRTKIDVAIGVKKAFYDMLATAQQVLVSEESIIRLERSLKDAYSRYQAGVSDKTDYKRATILLGNAKATLKINEEQLLAKQQYLKALMGYPQEAELTVEFDSLAMANEIVIDTLQDLTYAQNIDYQLLQTQKELQDANVKYSYWAFLPSVTISGAYNLNYQNNNFGELYNQRYPYSYIGATLTLPLFQGGKRTSKIQEQKLTRQRLEESKENLENKLSSDYTRAMAVYKSSLNAFYVQRDNVSLAQEVYDVVELQYRNGIKTYLDVTVAETDLRTTRINYYNALYQVLSSKLDVQRTLGQINY